MAQLVHLNGPPGIGKSTLAGLYVDRHPGVLNLDVDVVHQLIGGWRDDANHTWDVVWPLVRAMAAVHLRGGRDVLLPQYHGTAAEIRALEELAGESGAAFREVVLLADRDTALDRFTGRRTELADDDWVQHHGLVDGRLGVMYDQLVEVLRSRPDAVVVPSATGAIEEAYELMAKALQEQESCRALRVRVMGSG